MHDLLSSTEKQLLSLNGLSFIKSLLEYEENRFDKLFRAGSVYEEINTDFGIFPPEKAYPLYFAGDIEHPEDKTIFIGINPGYSKESNREEQLYLEKNGSFQGYVNLFTYLASTKLNSRYFSNIGGFLNRIGYMNEKISWEWCQKNMINMDLIPYHSVDASGLRINNIARYKERYFISLIKIITHLDPQKPVFITGFPTYERYFNDPIFRGLIDFQKKDGIWVGTIAGRYKFIGLPFLTYVRGGKDRLVESVKPYL